VPVPCHENGLNVAELEHALPAVSAQLLYTIRSSEPGGVISRADRPPALVSSHASMDFLTVEDVPTAELGFGMASRCEL